MAYGCTQPESNMGIDLPFNGIYSQGVERCLG
ncbi:MAG: hypothetical protein K0Q78_2862, partial [Cellvibrio sp.]|nr:hypothetical protein [Cellvibrio sp.]